MKRTLAVLAMTTCVLAAVAWPAAAKGEGPVGATITGPGLGGPGGPGVPGGPGTGGSGGSDESSGSGGTGDMGGDSGSDGAGAAAVGTIEIRDRSFAGFQNTPLWTLATFSGAVLSCSVCQGYIDTSPPRGRASLGPVYRVTYFTGRCCERSTRQLLYPYAPGGPRTYTVPSPPRDFFLGSQRVGWWHADGRMGQLFLRFLRHLGIPRQNPVPAVATKASPAGNTANSGNPVPWRLPLGIAAMIALLAVGAVAARPRSSTRPA